MAKTKPEADEVPLPEGVKLVPFDPERDTAPEGGPDDCDGG